MIFTRAQRVELRVRSDKENTSTIGCADNTALLDENIKDLQIPLTRVAIESELFSVNTNIRKTNS